MKININVDYRRKEEDVKAVSNQVLTIDYIEHAFKSIYKEGVEGQKRRIIGRIQRKFDDALEKKNNVVELETSEFESVHKAIKDAQFPPVLSKYVISLEDYLDEIDRKEKQKEKK